MSSDAQSSLPTASGGLTDFEFNGVFRELHIAESRDCVTNAQKKIASGDWKLAEKILQETLNKAADLHDVRNIKQIISEVERYQKYAISPSTRAITHVKWEDVLKRPIEQHIELFTGIPQSVFIIRKETQHGNYFLVGRRLLSHQYRSSKIRELHCSLVTAAMLLGPLEDMRIREDGIVLYFKSLTKEEKLGIMTGIYKADTGTVELTFPFPVLDPGKFCELDCPPGGWEIDEPLAEQLGQGEVILRQYSLEFLASLNRDDLIMYDPACSTGQFLSTMKQAVPKARTIGQDLSPYMVKFAEKRLDEIYCGDAKYPKIPNKSVDVVFVRFINSEVVKTSVAMSILRPLSSTVKDGGHMVIFGHTPVLMSSADLRSLAGWKLLQSIGGGEEWGGLFQYYVMKREG